MDIYQPRVSVVVPVYNGERTIAMCLDALVNQAMPDDRYEIIVVDNKSTDATCEIVRRYDVTLLHEVEIQTSYAARNRGIAAAGGDIVAFTDADCVAHLEWLSELIKPFSDPEVGGVGGRVLDSEPENEVERFIQSTGLFSGYQGETVFLPVLLGGSTAYRKDILEALGGFNYRLFTGADVDLSWRMQLETGARVAYAPEAIVYHMHRSTLSGMARQFHRHGFGEVFLDAMYHKQPGYQRTPERQYRRMLSQTRALITYSASYAYRSIRSMGGRCDSAHRRQPRYWFVIESNNLRGKIEALVATRFMCRNPAHDIWEDPGER